MIEIIKAGPLTTVQDLGRPGLAHLGVGHSGAADRPALALANRLVGNAANAAGLELTLGVLAFSATSATTLAFTGAPCPVTVGGRPAAMHAPLPVAAGVQVEVGRPAAGVRTYLAVRGGIAVEAVFGSRSTDLLAGLGPPVVRAGDWLPVGDSVAGPPAPEQPPVPPLPAEIVLRALPGPRQDWFAADALALLGGQPYQVSPHSDRIGLRLIGPALHRGRAGELPPEGMVTGAVQVPPDGQPVLLLADHPVTGGYPVIAVVEDADIALAAQGRPGQRVRFILTN